MPRPNVVFQNLVLQLRQQIKESCPPGEAIPSQRVLANMHGVGQSTVHRALCVLAEENLVRAESQRSWRRTIEAGRIKRNIRGLRVGLITRRNRAGWDNYKIYNCIAQEARRQGVELVEVPNERQFRITPNRSRPSLEVAPWNRFDVALLVDIEDAVTLSHPLLKQHRVLAMDQNATGFGLDSIAFNNRLAGKLAAQHLFELGHRRFGVADEVNDPGWTCDQAWTERRHGFEATLGELGGVIQARWRLEIDRYGPDPFRGKPAEAWGALAPKDRPTAIFSYDDMLIVQFVLALKKYGIRVPQDLSVIGTTWHEIPHSGEGPLLTCIKLDLRGMVRRAFEACGELMEREKVFDATGTRMNREPILFTSAAVLVPGESTAPPKD
jgi:DNA-binding LacI/PurR family transcriptional regulator